MKMKIVFRMNRELNKKEIDSCFNGISNSLRSWNTFQQKSRGNDTTTKLKKKKTWCSSLFKFNAVMNYSNSVFLFFYFIVFSLLKNVKV